jgi:hypothetical protein
MNPFNINKAKNAAKELQGLLENWVYSDEFIEILKSFGGEVSKQQPFEAMISELVKFSDVWDYRAKQKAAYDLKTKEAARWLITDCDITEEQSAVVLQNIGKLGLVDNGHPKCLNYDYIAVLGGARLSCLLRPRYANQLIKNNKITPKAVVMLSGMRPISDTEREATDSYAKNAATEYDLINRGAELSLNLVDGYVEEKYDAQNINESWAIRTYNMLEYDFRVISVSAPSSNPNNRRANSADTFNFFLERFKVAPGSSILLVTSQIYVPYQQLEALRTWALPHSVIVETVGFPNEWAGKMQGMLQPSNYLQEIRSTLQAMQRMLVFLKEREKNV